MKTKLLFLISIVNLVQFLQINAQDWPMWSGPTTNWHAGSPQTSVLGNLSSIDATKRVFVSEENTHEMRCQAQRYDVNNVYKDLGAGAASPLIYGNNLYQFYYEPVGPYFDRAYVKSQINLYDTVKIDQWKVQADEVFVCIDKNTGKTKWRTVLKRKGFYWSDQTKKMPANQTPAIGEGKIFSYGSTGRVYCLDANTGAILWENTCGARFTYLNTQLQNSIAASRSLYSDESHGGACFYTSGVFIASCDINYYAFNASTGALLWTKSNVVSPLGSGSFWRKDGKDYLVTAYKGSLHLIDPLTGTTLWQRGGVGFCKVGLAVHGDYVVLDSGYIDSWYGSGKYLCYKLDLVTPQKMWCRYNKDNFNQFPLIIDNKVYLRYGSVTSGLIKVVDLITGDSLTTLILPSTSSFIGVGCEMYYDGKIFYNLDGDHDDRTVWSILNPYPSFSKISDWDVNSIHSNEESYELPAAHPISDGKWYHRGTKGIFCYDITSNTSPISVKITSPVTKTYFIAGQTATITATASTTVGSIDKVEFYIDGVKKGEATASPYTINVIMSDTTNVITAKAIASGGEVRESYPVLLLGRKFAGIKIKPVLTYWLSPLALYDTNYVSLYFNEQLKFYYRPIDQFGKELPFTLTSLNGSVNGGGSFNVNTGLFIANISDGNFMLKVTGMVSGITITDSIGVRIIKHSQSITFEPSNIYVNNPGYRLIANSTSGLPVSFSIVSGPAILKGDTLVPTGTSGTVVIRASQAGNASFAPAVDEDKTILIKDLPVLSSVDLTPITINVAITGVVVFNAIPKDQSGDPMGNEVSLSYSVSGGGTISSEGIFSAGTVEGNYKVYVQASYNSMIKKDSSVITVTPKYRAISINFTNNASYQLKYNEQAGKFPALNWENVSASKTNLKDNAGVVHTTSISFTGTSFYAGRAITLDTLISDTKVMGQVNTNATSVTIANIPEIYEFYDVYVYTVGPSNNGNSILRAFSINTDTLWIKTRAGTVAWNGVYIESTATNSLAATVGQYVRFRNRSGSSFTIKGSGFCAIQIVGIDTTHIPKFNQTISLTTTDQYIEQGITMAYSLNAVSTSGLPVYYTLISGPATLANNKLTLFDSGTVNLEAWQPGNEAYNSAIPVNVTFKVYFKQNQIISWSPIADPTFVSAFPATITLNATASSGLPITYSVLSGMATVTGNSLTVIAAGDITLTASQPGSSQYYAAIIVTKLFAVELATQVKQVFENLEKKIYPNPVLTYLNIQGYKGCNIQLLSVTSQVLQILKQIDEQQTLDLNGLAKGMYLLQIVEGDKISYQKIIKK